MEWPKLLNAAAYFVGSMVLQVALVLALLKPEQMPTGWRAWVILIAGALVSANGKRTSNTRMSPIGYSRSPYTEVERREIAGLPPKRL